MQHVESQTAVTAAKNLTAKTIEIIGAVRNESDSALIFYSCGKDSIAMLDLIAPHFNRVVCVFMYFVKDLEHINKFINFSKIKYPNTEFIQVPHWNLSWIIREGFYCVAKKEVKTLLLKDVVKHVKEKTGIKYVFLGMKQADSLNRRLMLKGYELEAINRVTGMVYPLSHWNNKDVANYIKFNHLTQPISYTNKKKSQGLGFDLDVFLYLRANYTNDLKKIIKTFPLSEQILFEYDRKHTTAN